jgi:hypothetical protein
VDAGSNKAVTAQAVVFGLGSMFNHMRDPNVGWTRDLKQLVVIYKALRDIKAGEELCMFPSILFYIKRLTISIGISYGDQLTFKDTDPPSPTDAACSDILNSILID